MPLLAINTFLSNQAFSVSRLELPAADMEKYSDFIGANRWHYYGGFRQFQIHAIKNHCDKEHGGGEYRLFFLFEQTTGHVILLNYFSVPSNEHFKQDHFRKIKPAIESLDDLLENYELDSEHLRLLDDPATVVDEAMPSSTTDELSLLRDAIKDFNPKEMRRRDIVVCFDYYFSLQSLADSADVTILRERVLTHLYKILNSPEVGLYCSQSHGRVSLHIKLGRSAYIAFAMPAAVKFDMLLADLQAGVTAEKLSATAFKRFFYHSVQFNTREVLTRLNTDSTMDMTQLDVNLIIACLVEQVTAGELPHALFFQFLSQLTQQNRVQPINEVNISALIEAINIYYVSQRYRFSSEIVATSDETAVINVYALLQWCLPLLQVKHIHMLLELDADIISPAEVLTLLQQISGFYGIDRFRAVLNWCQRTITQETAADYMPLLEKILAEYKALDDGQKNFVYRLLSKHKLVFDQCGLLLPDKPSPNEVTKDPKKTESKHQANKKRMKDTSDNVYKCNDFEFLIRQHGKVKTDAKFISKHLAPLLRKLQHADSETRERFIQKFMKYKSFVIAGIRINLFELVCHSASFRVLELFEALWTIEELKAFSPNALYFAAVNHRFSTISILLEQYGYEPNISPTGNSTPFLKLFHKPHNGTMNLTDLKKTIDLFLRHGADINGRDEYGYTSLILALTRPVEIIEFLLGHGADPKQCYRSDRNIEVSPLDIAAGVDDNRPKMELLKRYGAHHVFGPVQLALADGVLKPGQLECVDERTVKIGSQSRNSYREESNALSNVVQQYLECALDSENESTELLLEHIQVYPHHLNRLLVIPRVSGEMTNLSIFSILLRLNALELATFILQNYPVNLDMKLLVGQTLFQNSRDYYGTLLDVAIEGFFNEFACLLIEFGASTREFDKFGLAAIHTALKVRNMEMLSVLIAQGDAQLLTKAGETLLHLAAKFSDPECLDVLLKELPIGEFERQLNSKDYLGRTPLQIVIATESENQNRFAGFFIASGASTREFDEFGLAAIHMALKAYNVEMLSVLINRGDAQLLTKAGETLLHLAVGLAEPEFLIALLTALPEAEIKRQLGCKDCHDKTPLQQAMAAKNKAAVTLLAGWSGRNFKGGITPLHLAVELPEPTVLQFLIEKRSEQCRKMAGQANEKGQRPVEVVPCHWQRHRALIRSLEEKVEDSLPAHSATSSAGFWCLQSPAERLRSAVLCNDIAALEKMITPDNVNTVDCNGNTLLHLACQFHCGEAVSFLAMQEGINLLPKNNAGVTPLKYINDARSGNSIETSDFIVQSRIYIHTAIEAAMKLEDGPFASFDQAGNIVFFGTEEEVAQHDQCVNGMGQGRVAMSLVSYSTEPLNTQHGGTGDTRPTFTKSSR